MAGRAPEQEDEATARWLSQGIRAAQAGRRTEARELLTRVVSADESDEQAWLWLSQVVDSVEDQRICLENVLVLNPVNAGAQLRLQALPMDDVATPAGQPLISYQSESHYDDVWSQGGTLCPYCAHRIADSDQKCPQCRRTLLDRFYSYEKPSANMHILWVMTAALGQLYVINVIIDIMAEAPLATWVLHTFLALCYLGLTAGLYFRQFWAYTTTIVLTLLLLALAGLGILLPGGALPVAANPAEAMITAPFVQALGNAFRFLQLGALFITLIWAALLTGPDFSRTASRRVAMVGQRYSDASSLHSAGRRLARQGMWASAVLHWQRAAALAPTNSRYLLDLGRGYLHLGFAERGLDTLQSARRVTANPAVLAEIEAALAPAGAQPPH